jgi:hypothetical protein
MKRFTTILAGLLAAQTAVAVTLTFSGSDLSAFKAQEPLAAFDASQIDQIAIDESGGGSVTLKKRDGKWITPSQADFPADGAKIDGFLKKLAELKAGWPVATTTEAARRFKVTDKEHERRIILSSKGKRIGDILIGTSPSYRQAHARVNGSNTIHNIAFATYEANTRPEEWMDHNLLDTAMDKIASISLAGVTIERKHEKDKDGKESKTSRLVVSGVGEFEKVNEPKLRAVIGAVSHPSFDAVTGKGAAALAKLDKPDVQFTVKKGDGTAVAFRYKKEGDGASYLFSSSAQNFVFRVKAASIDPILKAKREKLIEQKGAPVKIARDEIASVAFSGVTIERKDGKPVISGIKDNEKVNETQANAVIDAISRPSFDVIAGKGATAQARLENPDVQFTVKRAKGAPVTFKYKKDGDKGFYLFSDSTQDYVFRAKAENIAPLLEARREKLVETKPEPTNIPQDKMASIAFSGVTIERKDGKLTVSGLSGDEKVNAPKVNALVSAVSHPSFDAVEGKGAAALAKLENPDVQFTVKQDGGQVITFKYKKKGDGTFYMFGESTQDRVFRVKAASIEPILKASREKLVEQKKTGGDQANQTTTPGQLKGASGSVN